MSHIILTLILIVAALIGGGYILNSCTSTVADSVEAIASVNSPMAQAQANTAKLLGEVQAEAGHIDNEINGERLANLKWELARTINTLKIESEKRLIADAENAKRAEFASVEAGFNAATMRSYADTEAARYAAETAWVTPFVTSGALMGALIIGVVFFGGRAYYSVKAVHQFPVRLQINPATGMYPALVSYAGKVPYLTNPNTGEVFRLDTVRTQDDLDRIRIMAGVSVVALQTHGRVPENGIVLPR